MKTTLFLSVLLLFLIISLPAHACYSLINARAFGIIFNSNEVLSFGNFSTQGKEGTHYFRDCLTIKPDPSIKEVKVLTPTVDPIYWNDFFTIENISITSNILEIEVKYGGGCKTHEFMLYVDSIVIDGDPPVLNFTLLHNANEDACKAMVSETLVFNIKPVETLYSGSGPLRVQMNNKMMGIKWYRDNACTIKYRSHTSPNLLVSLQYSRIATSVFPSMRFILDTTAQYEDGFNYGKAITTELLWLIKNNMLKGVTEKTYSSIEQDMKYQRGEFWTYQDSLIPYGASFSLIRSSTGEWVWGEVKLPDRGCSSTFEITFPPEQLNSGPTSTKPAFTTPERENFNVKAINNTFVILLDQKSLSPAEIDIIDLNGRLVNQISVPAHQNSFQIQTQKKSGSGMYQVVLRTKNRIQSRTIVVSE